MCITNQIANDKMSKKGQNFEGVSIRIDRETWHILKVRAVEGDVPIGELASELLKGALTKDGVPG